MQLGRRVLDHHASAEDMVSGGLLQVGRYQCSPPKLPGALRDGLLWPLAKSAGLC